MNPNLLLDLGSLLVTTHMAGYMFGSDKLAVHNALQLKDEHAAVKEWYRVWDFGRRYGPASTMIPAVAFALSAYLGGSRSPSFRYEVAASAFSLAVVPFTTFIIFPINDDLLADHARITSGKGGVDGGRGIDFKFTKKRLVDWKAMDVVRLWLNWGAMIVGAVAVYKCAAV